MTENLGRVVRIQVVRVERGTAMNKYHIQLTEEESLVLNDITLHPPCDADSNEWYKTNERLIPRLMESLLNRKAIPEVRLSYFCDSKYQTDRRLKLSRRDIFEKNGTIGQDIYVHPHFLKYLRYFLFGACLPEIVITKFEAHYESVTKGNLTSGDYDPIAKYAKKLSREYSLSQTGIDPREEFFKLCLDMGLSLFSANIIKDFIRNVK